MNWRPSSPNVSLDHRQVHIWRAFLDVSEEQVACFRQCLSVDEIERAERFVFDRDRRDFVVGRGILRTLLGGYVKRNAADITLAYSLHGKPFLAGDEKGSGFCFNVAHSHGIALYAITQCGQVGIDVEYERPLGDDRQGLVRSVLSDREVLDFGSIPASQKTAMFYRYWTCKESFVKAIGEGLSFPVRQLEFTFDSGRLTPSGGHPVAHNEWRIVEFAPELGYAGAIVADAEEMDLRFWQYDLSHFGKF